ncbi:putative serpin E3 [Liparis tanakae]|uniref:Putative serpin E3 n=1 Tax=Liparis tanakae TaxID=230148 RepID=A0A4Z2F5I9_9TELE|nr:putative serpin E3 [Liparis tanakae]
MFDFQVLVWDVPAPPPPGSCSPERPDWTSGTDVSAGDQDHGSERPAQGDTAGGPDQRPETCSRGQREEQRPETCSRGQREDQRPETRDQRPETRDQRPETRDQRPETRDLRPETRDQRPETRDQRPETRDQRPETRDLRPGRRQSQSPEPDAWFQPEGPAVDLSTGKGDLGPRPAALRMRVLRVADLLLGLWLVGGSLCDGGLQRGMAELHGRLAVVLFQSLSRTEDSSNLLVSPASVASSLGLLQLGARGNTLAQLEATLGYDVKDLRVQDFLLGSQRDAANGSQVALLQQSCTLFVQSGVPLLADFTRRAAAWAAGGLLRADFSQANRTGRGAAEEAWPLQAGSSSGEPSGSGEPPPEAPWSGRRLQMALVNTVAFRGVWQKQFLFSSTQNLPFTLSNGTAVKVPMMHQAGEVRFGQFQTAWEQRYTVLELPYLGRALSLQVALPSDRKTPLSSLESQLSARQLASWDAGLRRTRMDVLLPRFRSDARCTVLPSGL